MNTQLINDLYNEIINILNVEMSNRWLYNTSNNKKKKRLSKPWWNEALSIAWRAMVQAERNFLKTKQSGADRQLLHKQYKHKLKAFDKLYRRVKTEYLSNEAKNIEEMETTNPKLFWRKLKDLGPQKRHDCFVNGIRNDKEDIITNKKEIRENVSNYFEMLYNREDYRHLNKDFYKEVLKQKTEWEYNMLSSMNIFNCDITLEEMEHALASMKPGKAPGHDSVPIEILKNEGLKTVLLKFLNLCFSSGVIPDDWTKALIKPLKKGGNKDYLLLSNYRGVSLLPNIYKLYSQILNIRLSYYLEDNGLLCDEQNGFRKGRSCMDHLYTLSTIIRNRNIENLSTYCCFVDMAKAFDSVDWNTLLHQCLKYGVSGKLYQSITEIYNRTLCSVLLDNKFGAWFETKCGVKQDNLSPILFSIYLNDLALVLKESGLGINIDENTNVPLLLYADDIVLIAKTEVNLQRMLDLLHDWCKKFVMKINQEKTQIVHFRRAKIPCTEFQFSIGKDSLTVSSKYKYLGCVLNETLDFTITADTLSDSAGRALGAVINKCLKKNNLSFKTFTKLYDCCVIPIMDYCAGVWGYTSYNKPQLIQNRVIRSFLGVHRFASVAAISGDTGWTSPIIRRHIAMLSLWKRAVCS